MISVDRNNREVRSGASKERALASGRIAKLLVGL